MHTRVCVCVSPVQMRCAFVKVIHIITTNAGVYMFNHCYGVGRHSFPVAGDGVDHSHTPGCRFLIVNCCTATVEIAIMMSEIWTKTPDATKSTLLSLKRKVDA